MISVITPVYKESPESVVSTIEHLASYDRMAEVIIVTARPDPVAREVQRRISSRFAGNVRIATRETQQAGRARQMNQGARMARSENLLFVHADSRLPAAADDQIVVRLESSDWGRFDVALDDRRPVFKILSWFINQRSRLTHICTGDQALYMRREFFERVGGFPEQELMEDIEFSIRAKEKSLPAVIKPAVITSARRWRQGGVVKTVLLMWRLRALYWIGVPPSKLAAMYRQVR